MKNKRARISIIALAVLAAFLPAHAHADELPVTLETPLEVNVQTVTKRTVREVKVRRIVVDLANNTLTVQMAGAPSVVVSGDEYEAISAALRAPLAAMLAKSIKQQPRAIDSAPTPAP